MSEPENKAGLVFSAHSADFVWRCAGAIAVHARRGWRVKVVCIRCALMRGGASKGAYFLVSDLPDSCSTARCTSRNGSPDRLQRRHA